MNNKTIVANAVQEYCVKGHRFYMSDLTNWVTAKLDGYVSPESPARRLRELRQTGALSYRVTKGVFEVL